VTKKESFTVEIAGGLGNQLFMFYAGLYFQNHFQREVIFDLTDLARIQELHPGANIESLGLLRGYQTKTGSKALKNSIDLNVLRAKRLFAKFLDSRDFTSDEIGFIKPDLVPLNVKRIRGYFQSWFYFDALIEKPVLGIEHLPNSSSWLMDKIERTKSENVLSLHVRRGDYALPANRMAGMLSYDYYREALMRTRDHDSIWIFTDSPKEVENEFSQLKHRFDVIVPPKDSDPVESLLLMAATKNIVISNSTFSWWSAMIAGDTASIHAPSKWYEHRADPSKLIPENWKRIPSEWVQR
jgi:hypothetical protein